MSRYWRLTALGIFTTAFLLISHPAWADTSDEVIQGRVEAGLFLSPRLGDSNIEINVSAGEVTMTGTVGGGDQRELAVAIAERIPGVESVTDDMEVRSDDEEQDGARQLLADAYLAWQEVHIRAELLEEFDSSPAMEDFDISFTFEGDTLTLEGTVGSDIERTIASQLSQRLEEIQVVNNLLEITDETDPMEAEPDFDNGEEFDDTFDSDMDVSPDDGVSPDSDMDMGPDDQF